MSHTKFVLWSLIAVMFVVMWAMDFTLIWRVLTGPWLADQLGSQVIVAAAYTLLCAAVTRVLCVMLRDDTNSSMS